MNIGMIIYSQTGNTRKVAERLREKLAVAGHTVTLEEIIIKGDTPAKPGKFEFKEVPAPDGYDALIIGAPVQAFSLNPVMKAYLEQLPSISGKKIAVFVTKQLPMLWVGGTGAIKIMKKACEAKGASVTGAEIVVWAGKKREQSIKQCVEKLAGLF